MNDSSCRYESPFKSQSSTYSKRYSIFSTTQRLNETLQSPSCLYLTQNNANDIIVPSTPSPLVSKSNIIVEASPSPFIIRKKGIAF